MSTACAWWVCMSRAKPASALVALGVAGALGPVARPSSTPATSATSTRSAPTTARRVRPIEVETAIDTG